MSRVILCETPDGCTCGAPASTPTGMHHCDCAIHPGWCGQPTCLPCERNGHATPVAPPTAPLTPEQPLADHGDGSGAGGREGGEGA